MIHSQNKWLFISKRTICFLAAMTLLMFYLMQFPLYAATPAGRTIDRVAGDVERGIGDIERGVGDVLDPGRDGLLPDGSLNNGLNQDGDQWRTRNTTPDVTGNNSDHANTGDGILDDMMPDNGTSHPSADNPNGTIGDTTDDNLNNDETTPNETSDNTNDNVTDEPSTTDQADDNEKDEDNGGFRYTGLIIAIIIAVAVILLICLLVPRKKNK